MPGESTGRLIGSATTVAAQHYLMAKDRHFEDAVGGPWAPVRPEFRREKTNAKSNAAGSRSGRQGAAEKDRTRCSHTGYSGFFGN
jgi:hypothetical protein